MAALDAILHVRLPNELRDRLRAIADENEVSMSDIVREYIETTYGETIAK